MEKRRRLPCFLLVAFLALLASTTGCTRPWFRKRADNDVAGLLREKDRFDAWKIEQYHVYPDGRSRFADDGNPDRPPMPPDDPAARELSPNPQKPGKAGVRYMEGTGYLDTLAEWDAINRADAEPVEERPLTTIAAPTLIPSPYKDPLISKVSLRPYRLKLEQALELGLFNSREFQDRREDLYLQALPVSVERFAFCTQFFATEELVRARLGSQFPEGPSSRWVSNSNLGFSQLFSTGALLLFRFANRTVLELSSPTRPRAISESSINFDAIQPLLRGGGHAVTLEPLTLSERNLLYEVRDYARFRKQFFVSLAAGADIGSSSVGATRFRNRPPAFLFTDFVSGANVRPALGGNLTLPASGTAQASGYLPVILNASLLENERQNVAVLEAIRQLFEAFKEGGDLAQLQVDRVEQQLLQGRSAAYQRDQTLRDTLDRFKLQLGVPTDLPLELDDAPIANQRKMLRQFERIIQEFKEARDGVPDKTTKELSGGIPHLIDLATPTLLRKGIQQLATTSKLVKGTTFSDRFLRSWARWAALSDEEIKLQLDAQREQQRQLLKRRDDLPDADVKGKEDLNRRLTVVEFEIDIALFEQDLRTYERLLTARLAMLASSTVPAVAPYFAPLVSLPGLAAGLRVHTELDTAAFRDLADSLERVLLEARNERILIVRASWPNLPRLCVDGTDLLADDLEQTENIVARTALGNRFDLMNARAQLVDSWRQIAVAANSLLGVFNVEYHLSSFTPLGENMPFSFSGSRSRHQLSFVGEAPLVRIQERNAYRASQIAWQRQRRTLMATEDAIVFSVRSQIRQLRVLAENYKIQQRAVELAYLQVENALDTFRAPPIPTTQALGTANVAGNNAALTQQLLEAQSNLNRAQNQLLTFFVQYLTTRMQLYRDLELMPLDARGVWSDDVETCHCPPAVSPAGASDPRSTPESELAPAPALRVVPANEVSPDRDGGTVAPVRIRCGRIAPRMEKRP